VLENGRFDEPKLKSELLAEPLENLPIRNRNTNKAIQPQIDEKRRGERSGSRW
jgi:hypothetical protein